MFSVQVGIVYSRKKARLKSQPGIRTGADCNYLLRKTEALRA